MDMDQIIMLGFVIYGSVNGYRYFKQKGKTEWSVLIPAAIAFFMVTGNIVFKYRLNILDWSFMQTLSLFFFSFVIMAVLFSVPFMILMLVDKMKVRKVRI